MNTRPEQDSRPALRTFGVRAAALAGLAVAVGVPVAGATGGGTTDVVIVAEPPNPSTCCGRDPEDPT